MGLDDGVMIKDNHVDFAGGIEEGETEEVQYEPETDVEDTAESSGDDEQADDADTTDRDAEIARSMRENCETARKNLKTLDKGQVRYINSAGEVIRHNQRTEQDASALFYSEVEHMSELEHALAHR